MPPPLAKTAGTLLHKQLFVVIQQLISRGVLSEGDRLPTQEQLCEKYGVSRITVRRALADLQSEGFIRVEQGVGAFVTSQSLVVSPPPSLGFVDSLRQVVEDTEVRVMKLDTAKCPAHICAALHLKAGAEAIHVVRTRSRKNQCLMLLEAWIPIKFEQKVTAQSLLTQPLFNLITDAGKNLGRVLQEVTAELADPYTAGTLDVEINSPILRIERLVHDHEQQPIQFLSIRSSPQRSRLLMDIAGQDLSTLGAGRLVHKAF